MRSIGIRPRRLLPVAVVSLTLLACGKPGQSGQPAPTSQDAVNAGLTPDGVAADEYRVRVAPMAQANEVFAEVQKQMAMAQGRPSTGPGEPSGAPPAGELPPGLPPGFLPGPAPQQPQPRDPRESLDTLEEVYALLAGAPVDVLEARPQSGVIKVTFRVRGTNRPAQTVFVSPDGRLLFQEAVDLRERLVQLQIDRQFSECLRLRGLRVFGDPNQPHTLQQLRELGEFGHFVLIDCTVGQGHCQGLGVDKLPAIEFRGKVEKGPKERTWIESLTGCK